MHQPVVRERAPSRPQSLTYPEMSRPIRTSRPRSFNAPSQPSPRFPDFSTKKAAPRHPFTRVPLGAAASLIILAIFTVSVFSTRNLTSFIGPSPHSIPNLQHPAPDNPLLDPPPNTERSSVDNPPLAAPRDVPHTSVNNPPLDAAREASTISSSDRSAPADPPPRAEPAVKPVERPPQEQQQQQQPPKVVKAAKQPQLTNDFSRNGVVDTGSVSWIRSWPASAKHDTTHLIPLADYLRFSNRTLINYFHMHKTGGVTTKAELMHLTERSENKPQLTKRGERLGYIETCYKQEVADSSDKTLEANWRCDFGQVKTFSKQKLSTFDIVMGHQYWENGCDHYFGSERDVRHFSLFRHPLPRKLSFFYHFFVRNVGREEGEVDKDEVIKFLLGEMDADPRVRDAGPNYYASRLLSDGKMGFSATSQRYEIAADKEDDAIAKVLDRLDKRFAFVGLQLQTEASQCMLEKAVQVMAHEHGIDSLVGTSLLSDTKKRLNTGGYPWTSLKIWAAMTAEQREKYRRVERVDLAIYKRAVERFKSDVKIYQCESKVDQDEWAEDAYE